MQDSLERIPRPSVGSETCSSIIGTKGNEAERIKFDDGSTRLTHVFILLMVFRGSQIGNDVLKSLR